MLDTGCSRSVILRSALPDDIKTSQTSTVLLCANEQRLNADVTDRNLQIKFNGSLSETTRPLVTDHRSCDLIIGIDCLRNFSYKENEDTAFVNGERIDLVRPHSQKQSARLCSIRTGQPTIIPPETSMFVEAHNPLSSSELQDVSIEAYENAKYKRLHITPTVAENSKRLVVKVRNTSNAPVYISDRASFYQVNPIQIESANGLTIFPDLEQEKQRMLNFKEKELS